MEENNDYMNLEVAPPQPDKFFKIKYHIMDRDGKVIRKEVHRVRGPVMPNPSSLAMIHQERVAVKAVEEIEEEEFNLMTDVEVVN